MDTLTKEAADTAAAQGRLQADLAQQTAEATSLKHTVENQKAQLAARDQSIDELGQARGGLERKLAAQQAAGRDVAKQVEALTAKADELQKAEAAQGQRLAQATAEIATLTAGSRPTDTGADGLRRREAGWPLRPPGSRRPRSRRVPARSPG